MEPRVDKQVLALRGISSMATKALLGELCVRFFAASGISVHIESVGGVDATKRVQSGESFDMVLVASDAIQRLSDAGHVAADSRCDWAYSNVAVAVPQGHAQPPIDTEAQLKMAVLKASKLSYSTGPSGIYLSQLFAQWGMLDTLKPRILVPPAGVPVASLLAEGKVDLGFQQRSELIHQAGISLLGDLPAEVAYTTVFSAGVGAAALHDPVRQTAVREFFQFIAADQQHTCRDSFGMR
jgi:molybdate transport system substrate-binding protein